MKYLRRLLFPFSLIYGLVVIIRNWCYDSGIFKSHRFSKPVICIGNLDVGGAGKTPMTEYLIRLLKNDYKIATLSRGYGRETRGFVEVGGWKEEVGSQKSDPDSYRDGSLKSDPDSHREESQESRIKNQEGETEGYFREGVSDVSGVPTVSSVSAVSGVSTAPGASLIPGETVDIAGMIGDEPAQFTHKFPDITVTVCEKRAEGINKLLPGHDVILLDDAFQHRAVSAGLNILLFDYNRLDEPHLLLPAGNLREPFSGRWRAQIIIVTKCPPQLTQAEQQRIAEKIQPLPYQQLFFTSIVYGRLQDMAGQETGIAIDKETTVFLLTGIANSDPLVRHLSAAGGGIVHHKYPDHHRFTPKNIAKLAAEYWACASRKKIIVTTEKDAMRLEDSWFAAAQDEMETPAFYTLPIAVEFLDEGGPRFGQLINDYVRAYTTNNGVH